MIYNVAIVAKMLAELLVRLVNQNEEFKAFGFSALNDDLTETIADYDIILIAGGIADEDIELIRRIILNNNLQTKLIEHYGGGSGLLLQELYEAINKK